MAMQAQQQSPAECAVSRNGRADRVAILLSTFNGERYLGEQLDSLIGQTHKNWVIYASDDGSVDGTRVLLKQYQRRLEPGRLVLLDGPCQGFARNFMSLVNNPGIDADYFAFCDQDDIWFENKLDIGLAHLKTDAQQRPALFCSRTRLIDAQGQVLGFSPLFDKEPTFLNALVQSLAGANTMLLNRPARQLIMRLDPHKHVVSHDWLAYLLVSGCGGRVIYDSIPTLDYRQHGDNLVGSNSSLKDRVVRLQRMYRGTFRDWTEYNLDIVHHYADQMTPDSLAALERFRHARQSGALRRLYLLNRSGVYRQTWWGNAGLALAASLGKI